MGQRRLGIIPVVLALVVLLGAASQDIAGPDTAGRNAANPDSANPGIAGQEADPVVAAAEALRQDPVFVDPSAERALTEAEAGRLRDDIRSAGTPLFVAVLPASAGDADDVVPRLLQETGLSGTYAAVVGDRFRATSTQLATADELATAAFQAASSDGTAAVLSRFVEDVAAASTSQASPSPSGDGSGSSGGTDSGDEDGGVSSLLLLGLLAAGGVGLLVWARQRRRRREERRAQLAADAEIIRAQLAVLADDVLRLEPEVVLHPDARNDYEAAVERHRVASAALDYADEPVDLVRVERVVTEAQYAMARAKALVAGREPPPPPEDLRRPGRHDEPPIGVDDRGVPVYAGGQPFYGGGWFGGGGGLFEGLLLGSMLGGWGWGGPVVIDHGGDGGDGSDGGGGGFDGGFGGGDWGGGDIGGGDWGGDVGGGDW